MIYSKTQELRSGNLCLEPDIKKGATSLSAPVNVTFLSCDGHMNQKWRFERSTSDEGRLVNVGIDLCLTLKSAPTEPKAKVNKILQYLSNIVMDAVNKIEAPVLDKCSPFTEPSQGQIWAMNKPLNFSSSMSYAKDSDFANQRMNDLDKMLFER